MKENLEKFYNCITLTHNEKLTALFMVDDIKKALTERLNV